MFKIQEKTQEEKTNDVLRAFNQHAINIIENTKNNYNTAFNLIWNNVDATPQEIFDAMGNEGYKVFEAAQKVIMHIISIEPTYVPPQPNYDFEINENGTVTITAK